MLSADGVDLAGIDLTVLEPASLVLPGPGDGDGGGAEEDDKGPITPLPNSPLLDLTEEETFRLASNPESPFTIYLDYTGHVTADPGWDGALADSRPRFGQPFTTPVFSIDNDPFSFSELELDVIQESFVRVAEDFAPFNVNVTTIEPSVEDLQNSGDLGDRYGIRVVIGGSASDWFLPPDGSLGGAGGVALLGSFISPRDTPAFAFIEGGIANPSSQALVVAHEVGHSLGLEHWGDLIFPLPPFDPDLPPVSPDFNEYNAGQGFSAPGNVSWGPILGAPFNAEVTQWSNGDYADATNPGARIGRPDIDDNGFVVYVDDTGAVINYVENGLILFDPSEVGGVPLVQVDDNGVPLNFYFDYDFTNNGSELTVADLGSVLLQDDLAIITDLETNGFGYREDDHVDTIDDPDFAPSPFEADFVNDIAIAYGLIETNTDVDFFTFDTDGGSITIDATPNAFGANLDIRFDVFDPNGVLVATGNPDFQLEASATFLAEQPGAYTVSVTGDAYRANPSLSEQQEVGYSDYGSLGRYTLTVNADLGAPPDEFEVNNSIAEATVLGTGDFVASGLSLHVVNDEDFFAWRAVGDGQLFVAADFLHNQGDVDLFVLDENGVVIGQSIGREDGESISIPVLDGELYYIQVVGFNGATQESYTLTIDGPGLTADEFEQNDTPEDAFAVTDNVFTAPATLHVAGDEDYYLWQAAADGALAIDVDFTPGADLAFEVLRGTEVVAVGQPSATGLSAVLSAVTGQLFRIRVFSTSGSGVAAYQLSIDGAAFVGDPLEPNSATNPTLIQTNVAVFNNISLHTSEDRDFFRFTAPERGTLLVNANFQHIFGDLDLLVVNESTGEQVALETTITDNESVAVPVQAGVSYLIETYGHRGELVPVYGLTTQFIAAPPVTGDADNDGFVTLQDYDVWLDQNGQTGPGLSADFNGDDSVDLADYTVWRDALSANQAAAQAAASGSGHEPGCCCASCTGQLLHDHNGDGIADHAAHDHPPFPAFDGEVVAGVSDPLLPPERGPVTDVTPNYTPRVSDYTKPPQLVQPGFVEAEPVESVDAAVSLPVLVTLESSVVEAVSEAETPGVDSGLVRDSALLLLGASLGGESEEDVYEPTAEDENEEEQAREDAFALVGDLL